MELYDALFADQDLEELLLDTELAPNEPLYAARARIWEGRFDEAIALAAGQAEPWSSLIVAAARIRAGQPARLTLLRLAEDGGQESRIRLWAWRTLRAEGERPSALHLADVLGFVVEVPMGSANDTLAAYADGRVRLFGHAGDVMVYEPPAGPSPSVIDVLSAAHSLMTVRPRGRGAAPKRPDEIRMTALAADGLHAVDVPWADVEPPGPHADLFRAAVKLFDMASKGMPDAPTRSNS